MLEPSEAPLVREHDVVMLDLDGVVYADGKAIPGAAEALASSRREGATLTFITNNASRTPEAVAELLTSLGVPAGSADVVTSAQAAASVLGREHPAGSRILCLGGEGLREAVRASGLTAVTDVQDESVVGVVTGYGPDVLWREIMVAATRIRDGLPWMATNTDWTIPTASGVAPGHGVMVRMLSDFTDVDPRVAGKPAPPLLEETILRTGAGRPLMVGDRLDTDIAGARAVGVPSLLVLTGVTDLEALVEAPESTRPQHLSCDLSGLLAPHPVPRRVQGDWQLNGWSASVVQGDLTVRGAGERDDWWRVVATAAWAHLDRTGAPVATAGLAVP